MINEALLYVIIILHFILVLFIVLTPFFGNNYFMMLHSIVVPFIILHWVLNDNNCSLTLMEKELRKSIYGTEPDPNECFTYNLIAPVYDFKKNNVEFQEIIYTVTITLWLISIYRLYDNWSNGKLSRIEDLLNY